MSWMLWWQITIWMLLGGLLIAFIKVAQPKDREGN